jgi:hypothetical protein
MNLCSRTDRLERTEAKEFILSIFLKLIDENGKQIENPVTKVFKSAGQFPSGNVINKDGRKFG